MTVKIYVDSREDDPSIQKYQDAGFDVITHKIDVITGKKTKINLLIGDYLITNGTDEIFIELKKGQDFFTSIFDGRKASQMADLSMKENSYYIMIGDPYDGYYLQYTTKNFENAYPQSVTNTIAGIGRKYENSYRVGFFVFPTMHEFQDFVIYHATKMKEGKMYRKHISGAAIRKLKKKKTEGEIDIEKIKRIGILMNADGIGYDKAKLLIEHFNGSAEAVLRASDKAITSIKGIGKKALEELRKLGFKHD